MKKLILMLVLLFVTAMGFAEASEINTQGLTAAQKAELVIQAEKMKEVVPEPSVPTVDAAMKWAEVGKSLAVGLGAGAKELNTAVNEFAVSPVGRVTTAIIVWKMMGKDILSIIISFGIFLVGLPCVWYIYNRVITERIEYEDRKGFWGWNRRVVKTKQYTSGDGVVFASLACGVAATALLIAAIKILPL